MLTFWVAVLTALCFSFLCSVSEAVLLSVSHAEIDSLGETRAAKILREFKKRIDAPIASILVVNTIAHTVGSSVAGATYGEVFDPSTLWIFNTVFTISILIFTEIIPKTLGVTQTARLATPVALFVRSLRGPTSIVTFFTHKLARVLTRGKRSPVTSLKEIRLLTSLGRTEGVLGARTADLIEGASMLRDLKARDVMVPRAGVVFLSGRRTLHENLFVVRRSGHSRFPYSEKGDLDHIDGIVLAKDLMFQLHDTPEDPRWESLVGKPIVVASAIPLEQLLRKFQDERRHLAIVLDEYGGTQGLVTLEDVLEEIGGEIEDESDRVDPFIIKRTDGTLICRGWAEVRKVLQEFDVDDEVESITVGGLVAEEVGRVPKPGDIVRFGHLQLEVLAASPRRAERLLVRCMAEPAPRPNSDRSKPDSSS